MAMPGMPGMGPSPIEQRIQEMEKRFQEQEAAKKSLESQLDEIGDQLKAEHEKVLVQNLRAKEEEALSARVEQQIRDMQDKLRREKHEQEIQESRLKAESQLKDLERRLTEERESWMVALKNQVKEREMVEQDVEKNLSRRLHESEERFAEEKNQWIAANRKKDEEISQLRRQAELGAEHLKEIIEGKEEEIEKLRESSAEQRHAYEREMQAELRALQAQVDNQNRETSTAKAQVALLQSQLQQAENQRMEERARAHGELKRLEEDLKREYTRREQERTQYWENIVAQLRSEKEALRSTMMNREEEITRIEMDLAETRRLVEVERARWKNETDQIRQAAREEAARNLPEAYEVRVEAERRKLDQQHLVTVQQLKVQLNEALDAQKGMAAKLAMLAQERERLQAELQEEQSGRDSQTKQFMQRIAELQIRESSLREEIESKEQSSAAQKEAGERAMAQLESDREEKNELLIYRTQAEKELGDLRRELKAMAQAQLEWKNTVVQLQNERNLRDQQWSDKEKQWETTRAEWEKTSAELEKARALAADQVAAAQAAAAAIPAPSEAPGPVGPEAAKALAAIRQQMQEMQTLLSWLKPVKKQAFNQAA